MTLPFHISLGFGVVTLFCLFALRAVVARHAPRAKPALLAASIWLLLTGTLAWSGFFNDFDSMPPRIPLFVLLEFGFVGWLVFKSPWQEDLRRIPQWLLIGLQCFRIPVEILLHEMAEHALLPVEMSFNGRNFDIITGVSALIVAGVIAKRGAGATRWLIVAWNVMGLALLAIVVVHGMLSTPYPFKVLELSMDNSYIATFPVVWLPMFLVPLALTLHLVSLRERLCISASD